MKKKVSDIGWNFSNSYTSFSETMYTRISPVPVKDPSIVIFNKVLSKELGLDFTNLSTSSVAQLFCGNVLPEGSEPLAQAYAGHQFGHFTNLGDGRAIVIGEHISPKKINLIYNLKVLGQHHIHEELMVELYLDRC